MDKSIKSVSKSFSKGIKSVSSMDGMNVVLFGVVVLMIMNAKMLRPMVSNVPGKLALVLFICFLATTDRVLGLLGVVLFMSVNNGLMEGMSGMEGEGQNGEAAGETAEDPAEEEEGHGEGKEMMAVEGNDEDCPPGEECER